MPRPLKSTAKRAAVLCRVSTENQNKADRYGLETQRQAAYDYAPHKIINGSH